MRGPYFASAAANKRDRGYQAKRNRGLPPKGRPRNCFLGLIGCEHGCNFGHRNDLPVNAMAKKPSNTTPVLLTGGNPQIAKADGDAPVQAYIAAMPGWKRGMGRRLDALITATVPNLRKAVKWNSPFYGAGDEAKAWFMSFHCFTKYIKVAFFQGSMLKPMPPGESKQKTVRYLDIHEDDKIDEAQLADWVRQASELPGERM